MPRIRSIKPEFFGSEAVAELEFRQMILWQGLWCYADDKGRCRDNPKLIKSQVFPLRDDVTLGDVQDDLKVLAERGRIERYEVAGRTFIQVTNWEEHQRPNKPQPAKFPAPPGNRSQTQSSNHPELFHADSRNGSGPSTYRSRDGGGSPPATVAGAGTESSRVGGTTEGRGEERRGSRAGTPAGARGATPAAGDPPTPKRIPQNITDLYSDPDNDAPCRRHPDDDRNCNRCGSIRRKHPDGYDPRPPELIPDDQLDVDAWADPALVIAAPDEVELGDPAARQAWYRQAGVDQLAARRAQARQRLADYQARHPA